MASSSFQRNKHSPSSVICFFKIVLRQSLEDGNLVSSFMLITKTSFILSFELQKFPKEFSMKYGDGVPNPVYLKPPDGTAWKIDWSEYDGAIQFENGWKEFALYYSLDHGHMMWFEYNKTSKTL
ncbi:hypothetical protein Ahy_A09g046300 [Arachis hypogaea]|uniref:TF-B3 domain-containing protein n=1 Tax=Arachis hypogaea TaxID=3818 RepID=A0A445BPE2_ARAHY|nr:hypothetical protein Ahy_A09g046300 [Arachis hypogaea]